MGARFSAGELRACAERELRIRKQVYPGYVLRHRMRQGQADREINMMQAIAEILREKEKAELLV